MTLRIDPIDEARRHWVDHGWGDAADGMALVTSITRVQQLFTNRIERILRPMGLTFSRYEVLMLLHFSNSGALPLGKIGERLQVQAGSVTNAIDRLEADGLAERRPHATDGRGTLAVITETGRLRALAATDTLNELVFAPLSTSSVDTRDVFEMMRSVRLDAGDFVLDSELTG
ncbi:MAG: MarR family transcriptional regulator [Ilumatobacteraceae bacterium]